jgi:hypothetical protein
MSDDHARPAEPGAARDGSRRNRRLGIVLAAVFAIALLMGPGPGILLVNPSDPAVDPLLWGVPKVYLWALFWYAVEAGVLVVAATSLWKERPS